jgi:hypothetical protein
MITKSEHVGKREKVDYCSLGSEAALLLRYIEGKERATPFPNLVN